jgi:MoaA/NifB/PqqE/SkfB family radical SAM enzyme
MQSKMLAERFIAHKLKKCVTGRKKDLEKLVQTTESMDLSLDVENFVGNLRYSLDNDTNLSRIFLRIGQETSRSYKKKLARNLIYNSFVKGKALREELDGVLQQARELGIYFIVISGGEPYLIKDTLLRMFKKYSDMFFLTYTNGTYFDQKLARQLGRLGNVAPAISVEGWQKETDSRRGIGVWDKVMIAMENLRNAGVMFGISVTQTKYNLDTILSDDFVQFFEDKGAIFGWYFMFMPVGKDPILDLVPTPEQRVQSAKRVRRLRTRHSIFLADFWNDGDAVQGCMAAGKGYMHVLNNGNVEPCVFAHFSADNIRDKSLFEAMNSPFFKYIRSRFPYNDNANLRRPCMIIDNPDVLRDAVNQYLVPHGHEHSEDLIANPDTVQWIDDYATEFKRLIDPIWDQTINDPSSRWYKHGRAYVDLFRFQSSEQRAELLQGVRDSTPRYATPAK